MFNFFVFLSIWTVESDGTVFSLGYPKHSCSHARVYGIWEGSLAKNEVLPLSLEEPEISI